MPNEILVPNEVGIKNCMPANQLIPTSRITEANRNSKLENLMFNNLPDDNGYLSGVYFLFIKGKPFYSEFRKKLFHNSQIFSRSYTHLKQFIDPNYDCFITPNRFVKCHGHFRRKDNFANVLTCLFLDLDTMKYGIYDYNFDIFDLVHYIYIVTGLKTPEIVKSGHGYYLKYPFLKAKHAFHHSKCIMNMYNYMSKTLAYVAYVYFAEEFNAPDVVDSSCLIPSKLLRATGSINNKYKSNNNYTQPRPCYVIYANPDYRHSFEFYNKKLNAKYPTKKMSRYRYVCNHPHEYHELTKKFNHIKKVHYNQKIREHPYKNAQNYVHSDVTPDTIKYIREHNKSLKCKKSERKSNKLQGLGSAYRTARWKRLISFRNKIYSPNYRLFGHIENALLIYFSFELELSNNNVKDSIAYLKKFSKKVLQKKIVKENKGSSIKETLTDSDLNLMINNLDIEFSDYSNPKNSNQEFYHFKNSTVSKLMGFHSKLYLTRAEKRKRTKMNNREKRSKRNLEIFKFYLSGGSCRWIAREFNISKSMVSKVINKIRKKIGVEKKEPK